MLLRPGPQLVFHEITHYVLRCVVRSMQHFCGSNLAFICTGSFLPQVLDLLPEGTRLTEIEEFLGMVVQERTVLKRRTQLMKSLLLAEHLQVSHQSLAGHFGLYDKGPSKKSTTSQQKAPFWISSTQFILNFLEKDNLSTKDKMAGPKVPFIWRFPINSVGRFGPPMFVVLTFAYSKQLYCNHNNKAPRV